MAQATEFEPGYPHGTHAADGTPLPSTEEWLHRTMADVAELTRTLLTSTDPGVEGKFMEFYAADGRTLMRLEMSYYSTADD